MLCRYSYLFICYSLDNERWTTRVQLYLLATSLEPAMRSISLNSVIVATVLLAGLLVFMLQRRGALSPLIFYSFSAITLVTVTVLLMTTLLLQTNSDSYGESHRQAEIEFWVCDTEVFPATHQLSSGALFSLDNRRVYMSGFVDTATTDATLGAFMQSIGGDIQSDSVSVPLGAEPEQWFMPNNLRDGDPQGTMSASYLERFIARDTAEMSILSLSNSQKCPNDNEGELQVFVYQFNPSTDTYEQRKLTKPEDYVFALGRSVPPTDCIIVEFSPDKQYTDKLCPSYGIRDSQRCSAFGVNNVTDNFCSYQEVRTGATEL